MRLRAPAAHQRRDRQAERLAEQVVHGDVDRRLRQRRADREAAVDRAVEGAGQPVEVPDRDAERDRREVPVDRGRDRLQRLVRPGRDRGRLAPAERAVRRRSPSPARAPTARPALRDAAAADREVRQRRQRDRQRLDPGDGQIRRGRSSAWRWPGSAWRSWARVSCGLRGRRAVLSRRTTSAPAWRTRRTSLGGSSASRTASTPISTSGMRTVVSVGHGVERRRGCRRSRRARAARAPRRRACAARAARPAPSRR